MSYGDFGDYRDWGHNARYGYPQWYDARKDQQGESLRTRAWRAVKRVAVPLLKRAGSAILRRVRGRGAARVRKVRDPWSKKPFRRPREDTWPAQKQIKRRKNPKFRPRTQSGWENK